MNFIAKLRISAPRQTTFSTSDNGSNNDRFRRSGDPRLDLENSTRRIR